MQSVRAYRAVGRRAGGGLVSCCYGWRAYVGSPEWLLVREFGECSLRIIPEQHEGEDEYE